MLGSGISLTERAKGRRGVWLFAVAGSALVMIALLARAAPISSATVSSTATPTPTPAGAFPPRRYDPSAPPGLAFPLASEGAAVADPDGYPRIVKLWGGYDAQVGLGFYTQYDMIISNAFSDDQLLYLRSENPRMIVLYSGTGTYDEDTGPLGSQWITAIQGTPEYECFYRGTDGEVLRVDFWGHGMFNMGDDWCTDAIVNHLVSQVSSRLYVVYDGVFFDRVTQVVTPFILDGIDLDHDGLVDDWNVVNSLYWRGTERFLDKVRQRLGDQVIIVANDAPLFYTSRLNGREYELFVRSILDGGGSSDWTRLCYNYEQWMQAAREPRLTMVMSNPPFWLEQKYGMHPYVKMKPAAVKDAAAYYRRMRFGLTTALMEDGFYSFEFGGTWHGNAWWYDEYDGAGLGKGYLGAPLGEAYYATGPLTTENVVRDPGFAQPGLPDWVLQRSGGAQATLDAVPMTTTYAPSGTTVARGVITTSSQTQHVRLEQASISLVDGQRYTLSFWGRATAQLWDVDTMLHAAGNTGIRYGLDDMVKLGTAWQHYWIPFTATATVDTGVLSLGLGLYTGTVWIDEVSLQQGALPTVFRRDFENGIALCNATTEPQTISLGASYRKIAGMQAPLVRIILDDTDPSTDEFTKIGGWAGMAAGYDEWGDTYHYALTTTDPWFISKTIWRPDIPRAGEYTVYVWVAPHANCNDMVTYEVEHAGGMTPAVIDPRVGEPTWVELGTYPFHAGTGNSVTLLNLTHSTWVVADAVKFESLARYNDGTTVAAVTLAGQDGIVLLKHLDLPYKVYLPLVGKNG
jgi:hypothetical protein